MSSPGKSESREFKRCETPEEFAQQVLDLSGMGSVHLAWSGYARAVAAQTGREPGEFLFTFRREERDFPTIDHERYRFDASRPALMQGKPAHTTQLLEGIIDLTLGADVPIIAQEEGLLRSGFDRLAAFNYQVFERHAESLTHPERYIVGTRKMPNRHGLERFVQRWKELHEENGGSAPPRDAIYCILDVDAFKQMNTGFGYDETNRALSVVGRTIIEYCRERFPWGHWYAANDFGDEFSWVLLGVKPEEAAAHVVGIRNAVASHAIMLERQGGGFTDVMLSSTVGWEALHPTSDFYAVRRSANLYLTKRKELKEPHKAEILQRYYDGLPPKH